jgi:predicted nucleotidyltransferase
MVVRKDQIRTITKEILDYYPEVVAAYLYGSYAAGTMTPLSDVDIALLLNSDSMPQTRKKLDIELTIESELIRKLPGMNIEARIINKSPLLIQGKVITEGILIYHKDIEKVVQFEEKIIIRYLDFKIEYDKMLQVRYNQEIDG